MMLFMVLGGVFLLAVFVIGFLFYLLSKESNQKKDDAVAITDLNELKKSLIPPEATKIADPLEVPVGVVAPTQDKQQFPDLSAEFMAKEEVYQKKVAELEGELQSIASKAQDQSKEALATIDQLKQENEQLKSERNAKEMAAQANLIQAQQTIESMQEQQADLQARLDNSQAEVGKLQDEMLAIKNQVAQQIVQGKSESEQLAVENEGLKRSIDAAIAEAAKNFQDEINSLKEENQALKNVGQEMTIANQKLKEFNGQLTEKAETLQWELTKARAQTTSLERACENYKNQLQEFMDRSASNEENNTKLSEVKSSLETELEDLRNKNEELASREQFLKFELEKNREHIVALERECANLKADISIKSDPSSQG